MSGLDAVQALYEAYIAKAEQLERDRKPGEGLFGFGKSPKDDPCHERFAADLQALLKDVLAGNPAPDEVREILRYIYFTPQEHTEPLSVYWMLQAVHGMTVDLAARLTPQDARSLRDEYVKAYRRWDRLPSHKKALAALDRAQKG